MSWAANRVTTRVEDRAYSLMGLFDINMPMIYGEREKAFLRLQQQTIQKSKDESIFAWDMEFPGNMRKYSGLFAPSPLAYADCNDVVETQGSRGFSESNGELSICSRLRPQGSQQTYHAVLNCTETSYPDARVFILLTRTAIEDNYIRIRDRVNGSRGLIESGRCTSFKERPVHVSVDPTDPPPNIYYGFWLRTIQPPGHDKCQMAVLSNDQTSEGDHVCQHDYDQGITGIVRMKPRTSLSYGGWFKIGWITFGFDEEFNPTLWLANYPHRPLPRDRSAYFPTLGHEFQRALTLGNKSTQHQKVMRAFKNFAETCKDDLPTIGGDINQWQGWASAMKVDRKIGTDQVIILITSLNLKISVQLQLQRSSVDDNGLSLYPMYICVVDITDTGGESPERRHRKATFVNQNVKQNVEALLSALCCY